MKKLMMAAVALCLACGLLTDGARPEDRQDDNALKTLMQAKRARSHDLVDALVREDFDALKKHARQLGILSQAAEWQVLKTPEYRQHSVEFRSAADSLAKAAEKKNLDGAALAYIQVTLKCVACHKYVNRVRNASFDDGADGL